MKKHDYEIRIPKGETEVDEIVAKGAHFHMEYMSDGCVWFGLSWPNGEQLSWFLHTKNEKAHIKTVIQEEPSRKKKHKRGKR